MINVRRGVCNHGEHWILLESFLLETYMWKSETQWSRSCILAYKQKMDVKSQLESHFSSRSAPKYKETICFNLKQFVSSLP